MIPEVSQVRKGPVRGVEKEAGPVSHRSVGCCLGDFFLYCLSEGNDDCENFQCLNYLLLRSSDILWLVTIA